MNPPARFADQLLLELPAFLESNGFPVSKHVKDWDWSQGFHIWRRYGDVHIEYHYDHREEWPWPTAALAVTESRRLAAFLEKAGYKLYDQYRAHCPPEAGICIYCDYMTDFSKYDYETVNEGVNA